MKELFSCKQCAPEHGINALKIREFEIDDDFYTRYTCENNHTTIIKIDNLKFEYLFESGAMAYIDGYKVEAVSTIASALERFYEFYIQILIEKNSINSDEYSKAWKEISNHSERQYGAFIFLYLMEKGEMPNLEGISKTKITNWKVFRNKVIHKGYIPQKKEVYEYMEFVFNYIHQLLIDLFSNYEVFISKVILNNRKKLREEDKEYPNTLFSIPRIIDLGGFSKDATFKEKFESLQEKMRYM